MEDIKMMNIIHKNCLDQRKINVEKYKKYKQEQFKNNILMFLSSGIFFIGLMYLISVIENMRL